MNCDEALLLIDSVLDGEANADEDQLLRFHLNGCARCRKAMLLSRSISTGVSELEEPEPPEDLLQTIMARIDSGKYDHSPMVNKSRHLHHWKIAAAIPFAAAALLLFSTGKSGNDPSALTDQPSMISEETVNYTPAPVMAYSRPSSVTTF